MWNAVSGLVVAQIGALLVAGLVFAAPGQKGPSALRASPETVLARATAALGGTAALNAVHSLLLARDDHYTVKILLPDRWQSILKTPWGESISTLDGDHTWARSAAVPEQLVSKIPSPVSGNELVRARRHEIARCSLKYLLRPPSSYVMRTRYVGAMTFGRLTGDTVEFTGADGYWIAMVFDAASGRPKAQVTRIGGDPATYGTHLIEEFSNYRPNGRIFVPLESAEYRLRSGRTESLAVWRFRIEVNPPLTKSDFQEPARPR